MSTFTGGAALNSRATIGISSTIMLVSSFGPIPAVPF
jgi:hypothetical protein